MHSADSHLLQSAHPALGQMAVLQHDPGAVLDGLVDEPDGDRPLALAQRQRAQPAAPEALVVGELEEDSRGIGTRGQDEDQRHAAERVAVGGGQVEGRRLHVLAAHLRCRSIEIYSLDMIRFFVVFLSR